MKLVNVCDVPVEAGGHTRCRSFRFRQFGWGGELDALEMLEPIALYAVCYGPKLYPPDVSRPIEYGGGVYGPVSQRATLLESLEVLKRHGVLIAGEVETLDIGGGIICESVVGSGLSAYVTCTALSMELLVADDTHVYRHTEPPDLTWTRHCLRVGKAGADHTVCRLESIRDKLRCRLQEHWDAQSGAAVTGSAYAFKYTKQEWMAVRDKYLNMTAGSCSVDDYIETLTEREAYKELRRSVRRGKSAVRDLAL